MGRQLLNEARKHEELAADARRRANATAYGAFNQFLNRFKVLWPCALQSYKLSSSAPVSGCLLSGEQKGLRAHCVGGTTFLINHLLEGFTVICRFVTCHTYEFL